MRSGRFESRELADRPVEIPTSIAIYADSILRVQSDLFFFSICEAAAKINTSVRELLSAAETYLIRPP
jgi:hypothetical protein